MENLQVIDFQKLIDNIQEVKSKSYQNVLIFVKPSRSKEFFKDDMKDFDYCISQIRNTKNKIEIDLRDNYIKDNMLNGICKLISNNTEINELFLWLPSNFITDNGVKLLLESISNLNNLKELVINLE